MFVLAQAHQSAVTGRELPRLFSGTYALIVISGFFFHILALLELAKMPRRD